MAGQGGEVQRIGSSVSSNGGDLVHVLEDGSKDGIGGLGDLDQEANNGKR